MNTKNFKIFMVFISFLFIYNLNIKAQDSLSLKDVVAYRYYPNYPIALKPMPQGEYFTLLKYTGDDLKLIKYSFKNGKIIDTILSVRDLNIPYIYEYSYSPQGDKVLICKAKKRIYRRSYKGKYILLDLKTKKITPIDTTWIEGPLFSPNGKKIAYFKDNNLYILDLTNNKTTQITKDGEKNKIINGKADWVYEEELELTYAYDWSYDSKYLAYLKLDESKVKEYNLIFYAGDHPHYSQYEIYPGLYTYKYPKAGEDNSIPSVHIYNTLTNNTITVNIGKNTDIYIPRIKWLPDENTLAVFKMNRRQNKLEILFADPDKGKTKLYWKEKEDKYIDEFVFNNFEFLPNGYLVIATELSGFTHLELYDKQGKKLRDLTPGKYDITKYYGYDKRNRIFYFQAAKESPLRREIYAVKFDGELKKLSQQKGTNNATFSSDFKYFINSFSNSTTPTIYTVNSAKDGKIISVLIDNSDIKKTVEKLGGIHKEFIKVPINGTELNAYILYPPNFDKTKKYPVIITGYNGPGIQMVLDSWNFGWEDYMARQGFIIANVDTRGTGARGEKFKKCTYLELGIKETQDVLGFIDYLRRQSFVDKDNIGVWGWSYGGFMVLNILTTAQGKVKCGVAVAPVTDWHYYDNIYTERYMRKPSENPDGYEKTSVVKRAENLQGDLLICIGLADDNVHPQNTFEFIEKLIQANIPFRIYTFPNRNHSIYGGNTRYFLYTQFTNFFKEKLLHR